MGDVQKIVLNNGVEMPILGFGVFQIEDLAECERSVRDAIDVGYRLIDTAASYGNEESVGNAIKGSGVRRNELFITTKLWIADTGFDKTKRAFDRSMKRLQLDYLDLYLIHQPYGDVFGSWRAMEELYREGRIKAIGLSNLHPDRVMDLIVHNEVVPAVDQVETHPFHQQVETQQHSDRVLGTIRGGKEQYLPQRSARFNRGEARQDGCAVILRWLTQRDIIVIPKSVRKDRMAENFDIFNFELAQEDMDAIRQLDTGTSLFFDHRDPAMVKLLSEAKRNT